MVTCMGNTFLRTISCKGMIGVSSRLIFLCLLMGSIPLGSRAINPEQQAIVDSLLHLIQTSDHDTARAREYVALGYFLYGIEIDTVIPLMNKAIDLSKQNLSVQTLHDDEKRAFVKVLADANYYKASVHFRKGQTQAALALWQECIDLYETIDDMVEVANSMSMVGTIYRKLGDIPKALAYMYRGLKIRETIGNDLMISVSLNNIAMIYNEQGDSVKATDHLRKSLKIRERINHSGIANSYWNMAFQFRDKDSTIHYLRLAKKHYARNQSARGKGDYYYTTGEIYLLNDQPDSAFISFKTVLPYYRKAKLEDYVGRNYHKLSFCATQLNRPALAYAYADSSLRIGQSIGYPSLTKNAAHTLYRLALQARNYQNAMAMYELYIAMRDSIANEANAKAAIRQQMKYEFEKKEVLLKAEQEKQALAHEEKVKRQELIIFSVGAGLLLVLVFSVFLFNRFKVTQRQKDVIAAQKKEVDEKNKHITDSIKYAQKIQEAILPSEQSMSQVFGRRDNNSNHFVLFRPKDVVSGDFYWMHETSGNKVIWAAADCTGHGVPGAFMSMIGTSLLNEIVIEKGITQSNEILDQLRDSIKKALGHSEASDSRKDASPSVTAVKDGMDIALCVWDRSANTLQFSGAYNPLFLVRDGELLEFKANRQPIGIYINEKPFDCQTISLQGGDTLYTFSDGLIDQFGGPEGRKFTIKRFRETILQMHAQPMAEQLAVLHHELDTWKQDHEQLDDICVFGVRV